MNREDRDTQTTKITQLASLLETANEQVAELLSIKEATEAFVFSLTSERNVLASHIDHDKKAITRLGMINAGEAAETTDLGDDSQGQIGIMLTELNTTKGSNMFESDQRGGAESMQSCFENREAEYKSTTNLEDGVRQQNEEASKLLSSNKITDRDLISSMSDRNTLASHIEDVWEAITRLEMEKVEPAAGGTNPGETLNG